MVNKIKTLFVFGTRPEAIKMAPIIRKFQEHPDKIQLKVCVTGQHREMLDQVLDFFEIVPDYDLDIMSPNQTINRITGRVLEMLEPILKTYLPDYCFVHGDTTTTLASSLAAFYENIKVCHVEAGLRTFSKFSPFPEEMNRVITSRIADIHFAPTKLAESNLVNEQINKNSIVITGNTVIDSLHLGLQIIENSKDKIDPLVHDIVDYCGNEMILVTGHRRENHGEGINRICNALVRISKEWPSAKIIFPVHLNPNIKKPVEKILSNHLNIKLIEPQTYPNFIWLMKHAKLIITDSGGIQEEAPSLGIPVLLTRSTTERPEAITSGTVKLVGNNSEKIALEALKLLKNKIEYQKMSNSTNPYGDGKASERIYNFLHSL